MIDQRIDFAIREIGESDLPHIVRLRNLWEPEPISLEVLYNADSRFPPEGLRRRVVAELPSGEIAGYGDVLRFPHQKPGDWWLTATVDLPWRCQGLGRRMVSDLMDFGRLHGAARFTDYIREDSAESIRFAEELGATRSEHVSESYIDPRTFDETPYLPLIERLENEGIRFFSYADTARDEEAVRSFHEVFMRADRDMPHSDPKHQRSVSEFKDHVFCASWFRPEGVFIAADGDRWIGLCTIGFRKADRAVNDLAGVHQDYRGRGIATALKVLALRYTREVGVTQLRTNNHLDNGPMLAINRKLGYVSEPGWFRYDLSLEEQGG